MRQKTENKFVSIPAAELNVSEIAPTVSVTEHKFSAIPAATLDITENAPTIQVSTGVVVNIPTSPLTLSSATPEITVTQHKKVIVPVSAINVTEMAPLVTVSGQVEPEIPARSSIGGGGYFVNPYDFIKKQPEPQNIEVTIVAGVVTLTTLTPSVIVSDNKRVDVRMRRPGFTGLEPQVFIQYDERRAQEERELIDILSML